MKNALKKYLNTYQIFLTSMYNIVTYSLQVIIQRFKKNT